MLLCNFTEFLERKTYVEFFIPWNCIKVVEYFVQIWWLYRTKKMVICTDIYISGKTHILIYPFLYSSCTFLYVFIYIFCLQFLLLQDFGPFYIILVNVYYIYLTYFHKESSRSPSMLNSSVLSICTIFYVIYYFLVYILYNGFRSTEVFCMCMFCFFL